MIMRIVACVALALLGCKGDAKSSSDNHAADFDHPKVDWSHDAVSTVQDEVDGHHFAVDLPSGLKREAKKSDGTYPGYVTWTSPNPFEGPSFTVRPIEAAMLPSDWETVPMNDTALAPTQVVTEKALLAGGSYFVIEEPDKKFLEVSIYKKAPGGALLFEIMQRTSAPMAAFDAERAWFLKIGRTLVVK